MGVGAGHAVGRRGLPDLLGLQGGQVLSERVALYVTFQESFSELL